MSAADPGPALPQFRLRGPGLLPRPGPGGGPALAVLRQVQDEDPQHQREGRPLTSAHAVLSGPQPAGPGPVLVHGSLLPGRADRINNLHDYFII